MTEYSRMAKGSFTSTGAAKAIYLPFQPDRVHMYNYSLAAAGVAASKIISAEWDVAMGQGFAVIQGYSSGSVLIYDNITVNGITSFAAGTALQYGPNQVIGASGSITAGAPTDVVTTAAHGLATGDWVVFNNLLNSSTTGMQQIAGIPFQVTVTSTTAFNVNWDTSGTGFTTITGGSLPANNAGFKKILYPVLYAPADSFISAINTSTLVVTTTAPHNFVVGQEIAFRIPTVYGTTQLNSLPDVAIPGQPLYYYVSAVGSSTTFTIGGTVPSLSAFVPNQPFASYPGLSFPQVCAVGDVNSGGYPYTGGSLYPSPTVTVGATATTSINGPAIQGAFFNNTRQGFIIGKGAGTAITSGVLVGANTNVIYWEAFLDDISMP